MTLSSPVIFLLKSLSVYIFYMYIFYEYLTNVSQQIRTKIKKTVLRAGGVMSFL